MARVEGTGPAPRSLRQRIRIPRFDLRPEIAVAIAAPAVLLAPDPFLRAIAVTIAIVAAWGYGYFEGRADHAREVIRELGRDAR